MGVHNNNGGTQHRAVEIRVGQSHIMCNQVNCHKYIFGTYISHRGMKLTLMLTQS